MADEKLLPDTVSIDSRLDAYGVARVLNDVCEEIGGVLSEQNQYINTHAVKGDTGAQGPTGSQGVPGKDGITPTVQVGTTTTGYPGDPASVINVGSGTEVVLNFDIPRGQQGVKGDKGSMGDPGVGLYTLTRVSEDATGWIFDGSAYPDMTINDTVISDSDSSVVMAGDAFHISRIDSGNVYTTSKTPFMRLKGVAGARGSNWYGTTAAITAGVISIPANTIIKESSQTVQVGDIVISNNANSQGAYAEVVLQMGDNWQIAPIGNLKGAQGVKGDPGAGVTVEDAPSGTITLATGKNYFIKSNGVSNNLSYVGTGGNASANGLCLFYRGGVWSGYAIMNTAGNDMQTIGVQLNGRVITNAAVASVVTFGE